MLKNVTYFDSFPVEYIPKEIRKLVRTKNMITNIFRMQTYDWIVYEYICIEFNDLMSNK